MTDKTRFVWNVLLARWLGILLLLPSMTVMVLLMVYPLIDSVWLSFHSQALYELEGIFVGLANYVRLFQDPSFWSSVYKTFIWTGSTLTLQIFVGLGAALALNQRFRGRGIARALVLLPYFMPTISACLTWRWMYNDICGVINYLLASLRIIDSSVLWLSSDKIAMISVIIVGTWKFFPFVVISVLARLQTIPLALYDAAKVDGAGALQCFTHITLPQTRGILLIVILLRWIFMFNKFDVIWILTQGGPLQATETLPVLAYETSFVGMRMGEAAGITTILLSMSVSITLVYLMVFKPARSSA